MHTFILTDAQQVTLAVAGTDAAGNPKAVFGIPSWTSSDPATLTVTPSADGFTAATVCQCDLVWVLQKQQLHDGLGLISWERQQAIKLKLKETLRL